MADVRSLLRQQNQARRIEHPYASYSDAGKLLCTLCRDQVRAESQWDSHLQSDTHRQRLQAAKQAQAAQKAQQEEATAAAAAATSQNGGDEYTAMHSQKRKVDDEADAMDVDDAARRKRSRADISIPNDQLSPDAADASASAAVAEQANGRRDANRTPPTLVRRMSSTPSRGVELQIPSRPATPAHRDSSNSTPGAGSLHSGAAAGTPTTTLSAQAHSRAAEPHKAAGTTQVDEAEWAAFEADIAAAGAPYSEDAVISAPAMNADQVAAAAEGDGDGDGDGGDHGKRRLKAEAEIAGEKEDATKAMEDEFDDMQELEARVKRLKEKREELRKRTESNSLESGAARPQVAVEETPVEAAVASDEEDDDDDDDDDWDGFRFRTS